MNKITALQTKDLVRPGDILYIEPFHEGSTEYFIKVLLEGDAEDSKKQVIRWQWIERVELAPVLFDDGPWQWGEKEEEDVQ